MLCVIFILHTRVFYKRRTNGKEKHKHITKKRNEKTTKKEEGKNNINKQTEKEIGITEKR